MFLHVLNSYMNFGKDKQLSEFRLEPDYNCFWMWDLLLDLYPPLPTPLLISFWRIKKKKIWINTAAQNCGRLKAMVIRFLFQNSLRDFVKRFLEAMVVGIKFIWQLAAAYTHLWVFWDAFPSCTIGRAEGHSKAHVIHITVQHSFSWKGGQ